MKLPVLGVVSGSLLMAGAALASETMLVDPYKPVSQGMERRLARVESLDGRTGCQVALAPNGVLQFTASCSIWPRVERSKQWVKKNSVLRFLDAEGRVTATFYAVSGDVFLTGYADPEFLRLTILPPPAQLRFEPSIPLKQ